MKTTSTWKEKEEAAYNKWKAEYPDVMETGEQYESIDGMPHEWWVRNYVETRLFPLIKDLLATAKREGAEEERERISAAVDELEKEVRQFKVVHEKDSVQTHRRGQLTGALDTLHEIRSSIAPKETK